LGKGINGINTVDGRMENLSDFVEKLCAEAWRKHHGSISIGKTKTRVIEWIDASLFWC